MARIPSLLGLLVALVGCSTPTSPDTPSLTGVWNIAPPSPWSRFRLTLTQTGSLVGGSADIQGQPFNGTHQVLGTAAVDTFALHFGRVDGGRLNLYGRLVMAGSLRGTFVFTDLGNHDLEITELHFNK